MWLVNGFSYEGQTAHFKYTRSDQRPAYRAAVETAVNSEPESCVRFERPAGELNNVQLKWHPVYTICYILKSS